MRGFDRKEVDKAVAQAAMAARREIEEEYKKLLDEAKEDFERRIQEERAEHERRLAAAKETYEGQLDGMIKICNRRVAEANRKAENLYHGVQTYKGYLEEYSATYGDSRIRVVLRDDGVWFVVETK